MTRPAASVMRSSAAVAGLTNSMVKRRTEVTPEFSRRRASGASGSSSTTSIRRFHEIALLKSGIVAVVTRHYGPGKNTRRYRP